MIEGDDLIRALREDLPSAQQEERMRRRLLSAGLAVGGELVALNAASQTAVASSAVGAKLMALSLPAKLGLGVALAASVSVPLWRAQAESESTHRAVAAMVAAFPVKANAARERTADELAAPVPENAAESVVSAPVSTPPDSASESGTPRTGARVRAAPPSAARDVSAFDVTQPAAPAVTNAAPSAVAAFELPGSAAPVARAASPAGANAPLSAPASTLAEETRILDRAFAEIAAGNRNAAAALIAEHAARFPNGVLKQEREQARNRLNQAGKE